MKKICLFIFSSMSSLALMTNPYLTGKAMTQEVPLVDLSEGSISFDDVVVALKGDIKTESDFRSYDVENHLIQIAPHIGYGQVNGDMEPYVLKTSKSDSSVHEMELFYPVLLNEELFVPIEYVTRILGLQYEEGFFKKDDEVIFEGKDLVEKPSTEVDDLLTEESIEVVEPEDSGEPDVEDVIKPENSVINNGNQSITTQPDTKPDTAPESGVEESVTSIIVNTTVVKVEVGSSVKVDAVVDPVDAKDATLSWVSEDSSIATVDGSGNVVGKSEGVTTIVVKSNMNPTIKQNIAVTVVAPPVVNASSISIDKSSITLEAGSTAKVIANVLPTNVINKTVTWSSENQAIATVDGNGTITAKAAGTTRIVVTSVANKQAKAYITITVTQPVSVPEQKPEPEPTLKGQAIVDQLRNEGWYHVSHNAVYYHHLGDGWTPADYEVYVVALGNSSEIDLRVQAQNRHSTVIPKMQSVLSRIIPSGASKIIQLLQTSDFSGGDYVYDGRKVKVHFDRYGFVYIDIYK